MSEAPPKSGEFNEGKLWFYRKGTSVTLGVTSLSVEEIGEVQGVELPDEGDDFQKGDVVVTVEGANGKCEIIAPASGFVQEINGAAQEDYEVISEDPLEEGWLVKLQIEDTSELKEFALGD